MHGHREPKASTRARPLPGRRLPRAVPSHLPVPDISQESEDMCLLSSGSSQARARADRPCLGLAGVLRFAGGAAALSLHPRLCIRRDGWRRFVPQSDCRYQIGGRAECGPQAVVCQPGLVEERFVNNRQL